MGYYYSKCPYCGRKIEGSYAKPMKKLGNPQKMCIRCGGIYLDSNIVDWDNAHWLDKILYFFANGRIFFCALPFMLVVAPWDWKYSWVVGLAASLIAVALCWLYVKKQVDKYRRR